MSVKVIILEPVFPLKFILRPVEDTSDSIVLHLNVVTPDKAPAFNVAVPSVIVVPLIVPITSNLCAGTVVDIPTL